MLRLLLLRHAKSSWDDEDLDDHERPLSRRGAKDAPLIGRFMAAHDLKPDLVLCSDAVRARATLTLVMSAKAGAAPRIMFEAGLYLAPPDRIRARLSGIDDAATVLVVGHNPGLHALALSLVGEGAKKDLALLATGFPTACLAVIEFAAGSWRDIAPATGRLQVIASPKRMPGGSG